MTVVNIILLGKSDKSYIKKNMFLLEIETAIINK